MLRCFVCVSLITGLASGPCGSLSAQPNKTWQEEQLKKLRGRWSTFQEQKVRTRVNLEFAERTVKVFVFNESGKRLFDGELHWLGVETVPQPGLGQIGRLGVGSTSGTGKTDLYYDFVGEKLILVGRIGWRPFEGFNLSGEYKRAEAPK